MHPDCTVGCVPYGTAKSRPCFNWDNLFKVCAPWTDGPDARAASDVLPLGNGCPLDPNNLPKAASDDVVCDADQYATSPLTACSIYAPIKIDSNAARFSVRPSGRFEKTFGLYTKIPPPI